MAVTWAKSGAMRAPERRQQLFRHRFLSSRSSRIALCTAAGTVFTASVGAAAIAAGPALLTPSADRASAAAGLALARDPSVAAPAVRKPQQTSPEDGQAQPENPALVIRQALNERYAAAVRAKRAAARHAAEVAARRAAERARRAAEQRRQAAASRAATSGAPQQIAMAMLSGYGWSSSEFSCLNSLWEQESGWNPSAYNSSSGAYGIPQAVPGSKMASAGADWQTNAATQIRWGLGYIKARYGSPCAAWSQESSAGWY
jgi:hypothetical protein